MHCRSSYRTPSATSLVQANTEDLAGPSLRLDLGVPDNLGPFLGFIADELAELDRRKNERGAAQLGEPRLYFRVGKSCIDLFIELEDDLRGGGPGRAKTQISADFIARQEFVQTRDVWQRLRAGCGGYRQRPEFTRPDVFNGCRQVVECR